MFFFSSAKKIEHSQFAFIRKYSNDLMSDLETVVLCRSIMH